MITVDMLLRKDSMSDLRFIAGHIGGNRVIRAISVMDAPDSYKWLKGGEFIITSGYLIGNDEWQFEHLVKTLIESNSIALGVKRGRYISNIPENVIQLANASNFPIVEIPYHFGWSEISEAFYGSDANVDISVKMKSELSDTSSREQFYHEFIFALESKSINDDDIRKIEEFRNIDNEVHTCIALIKPIDCVKSLDDSKRLFEGIHFSKIGKLYTYTVKNIDKDSFTVLIDFIPEIGYKLDNWQYVFISELEYCIRGTDNSTISVGSFYSKACDIIKSYEEANEAYIIGKILWKDSKCFYYPLLSIYSALRSCDINKINLSCLQILKSSQAGLSFDAEETLETYIESENLKTAASKLYIHENTLRYRLQRIEDILHLNLDKATVKNALITQIKYSKLLSANLL